MTPIQIKIKFFKLKDSDDSFSYIVTIMVSVVERLEELTTLTFTT